MTAQEDLTGMPTPGLLTVSEKFPINVKNDEGTVVAQGWADGRFTGEQYAALIVKAVNAYSSTDALRSALAEFLKAAEPFIENWHRKGLEGGTHIVVCGSQHRALSEVASKARTALAGVTAPATRSFNEHMVEELIVAAYKRGFHFNNDNEGDDTYLTKAAHDYADKTMNAPSAGVTAPKTEAVTE